MSEETKPGKVRSRNEPFVTRTATRIWRELPSDENPYITASALCHGYELFELMEKRSYSDMFYLLFRGELPNAAESGLLQQLMVAMINPGPRHPATRAAMNAGIGKTESVHILPIASAVLGGSFMGAGEIEDAMRFLRKHQDSDAAKVAQILRHSPEAQNLTQESTLTPGFGCRNGGLELMAIELANRLVKHEGAGKALRWGCQLSKQLQQTGSGWLLTGVVAAVLSDLGFHARMGASVFQLLGAPGLVAHGLEVANKPITAMPFVSDENYVIER